MTLFNLDTVRQIIGFYCLTITPFSEIINFGFSFILSRVKHNNLFIVLKTTALPSSWHWDCGSPGKRPICLIKKAEGLPEKNPIFGELQ